MADLNLGINLGTVNKNPAKKIAIIGGGPGGYVAAIRAAQLGAEVTLIEKDKIGGTCLNVGCIPTKSLLHSAEICKDSKKYTEMGINAEISIDWGKIQSRKNSITKGLAQGVQNLLKANKVEIKRGKAEFVDSSKLRIMQENGSEEILSADKIIIAAGSVPSIPPIPGIDNKSCITSTEALSLKKIPNSLAIIGGGVIGIETAYIYNAFGTKVTIIEMLPGILPMMDGELTEILKGSLVKSGIGIYTNAKVLTIEETASGAKINANSDGREINIEAEKVLVAVGRRPDTSELKLENAGILNEKGWIKVNDKQETNVKGIYAVGDCASKAMLAHVASMQGEIAAENAMGIERKYDKKTNPSCIYTNPEFASVGLTEEKAKEMKIDYITGKFPMAANGKAQIMGCKEGMVKIIADAKYKEILGVHILGPRATDLITEGALALRLEATLDELVSTIHAHPTIGETMREAALAAENRAIHVK